MEQAQLLLQALKSDGAASLVDQTGRKLFFILSSNLGQMTERGVLIAYEGKGCFFWDGIAPLNKFRLFSMGFDAIVAPTVLSVLDALRETSVRPQPAIEDKRKETP